jgi:hypothetical protein
MNAYRLESAQKYFDQFTDGSSLLQLTAHATDNDTGQIRPMSHRWEPTPGTHFRYSMRLCPKHADGASIFQLNFSTEDFWALHSLLVQIKELNAAFLRGEFSQPGFKTLTGLGHGLCFEATYGWSNMNGGRFVDGKLEPFYLGTLYGRCQGIDFYLNIEGRRYDVGRLIFYSGLPCLANLVYEAQLIAAMFNGTKPKDLDTVRPMETGRLPTLEELLESNYQRNRAGLHLVPVKTP